MMTPLEQKLTEIQLEALKLQHLLLKSQLEKHADHDQSSHGRGGGGGGDLQEFADDHGGRIVNGMLVITAPKLLSAGKESTEVGPSSRRVQTLRGQSTIHRRMGQFYEEDSDGMQRKLKPDEELTIIKVLS